jgi:hypothetical protein
VLRIAPTILYFSLFCLALLGLSCEPDNQPVPPLGYEYYPLRVGKYLHYRVDETTYALARPAVSRTYEIRETLTDSFPGSAGETLYRVERAVRTTGGNWQIDSVMTAWRTVDRALRNQNGNTEIKLVFPLANRQRWNGNLFNTLGERLFEMNGLARPLTLGTQRFDSTVTVVQQNDSTLVALRRHREVYARDVGLVRRERANLFYCSTPGCAGQGKIDFGMQQTSTLIGYGMIPR